MSKNHRNRVIYQSEALFVSPNASGAHFTCSALLTGLGATGDNIGAASQANPTASFNGGTYPGNKVGYMSLVNPIGLNQDPYITNTKSATDAQIQTAAEGVSKAQDMATRDLAVLSGEAVSAWKAHAAAETLFDKTSSLKGLNAIAQAVGDGGVRFVGPLNNATVINNLTNNASGELYVYNTEAKWNAALSGYYNDKGGAVLADKNNAPLGVFIQPFHGSYENLVQQLHRVQSANYSFTINRTDINTFGQLARIDAIALEPPTVNLDFSYLPTDGFNERNLGFHLQGADSVGLNMTSEDINASTHHIRQEDAGKNFFILTTPEQTDAFHEQNNWPDETARTVLGLGNGYITDYSFEASVGSLPTTSTTVELYNATSTVGSSGQLVPSVNLEEGTALEGIHYTLAHPKEYRGDDGGASPSTGEFGATSISALRPGDITLSLPQKLALIPDVEGDGSFHIQSFNLSMPLSRSPIDRLGSRFSFARVVDTPVVATLSVSALLSEVGTGNLANLIDDCDEHDIQIKVKANQACDVNNKFDSLIIDFRGARIESESISSDIGSNKSIDLSFTAQIGGPDDKLHGVFISGANRSWIPQHYQIPGR